MFNIDFYLTIIDTVVVILFIFLRPYALLPALPAHTLVSVVAAYLYLRAFNNNASVGGCAGVYYRFFTAFAHGFYLRYAVRNFKKTL